MDKLKAFVESMTIWNWLTLIAFLFFPLGALNAFFGLRSRYRDWKGARTKKGFEKRLKQLEAEWLIIESYKKNLPEFFLYLLEGLVRPVIMTFVIVMAFIAFSSSINPFGLPEHLFETVIANALRLAFGIITFIIVIDTMNLFLSVTRMRKPDIFGMEIIDFASNAKSNGFESTAAKDLITRLVKSDVFDGAQRDFLKTYIMKNYPDGVALLLEGEN